MSWKYWYRGEVVVPPYSSKPIMPIMKDGILQAEIPMEGTKYDSDKLRYDLLAADALEEVVKVYTMGAKKYADRNWEKGIKFGRVFGALMRHSWAWWAGERNAKDDGQHHLASAAWCALALLHYDLNEKYKPFDDRPVYHEPPKDSIERCSLCRPKGFDETGLRI